jgi:hypothetical protein
VTALGGGDWVYGAGMVRMDRNSGYKLKKYFLYLSLQEPGKAGNKQACVPIAWFLATLEKAGHSVSYSGASSRE